MNFVAIEAKLFGNNVLNLLELLETLDLFQSLFSGISLSGRIFHRVGFF